MAGRRNKQSRGGKASKPVNAWNTGPPGTRSGNANASASSSSAAARTNKATQKRAVSPGSLNESFPQLERLGLAARNGNAGPCESGTSGNYAGNSGNSSSSSRSSSHYGGSNGSENPSGFLSTSTKIKKNREDAITTSQPTSSVATSSLTSPLLSPTPAEATLAEATLAGATRALANVTLSDAESDLAKENLDILQAEFTTLDPALIISIHLDSPHCLSTSRTTLSQLCRVTNLGEDDNIDIDFPPTSTIEESTTPPTTAGDDLSEGIVEEEGELVALKRMFPSLKEFVLVKALEKCKSRGVEATVDELLNRVFLDEGVGGEDDPGGKGGWESLPGERWRGIGRGVDGFRVDSDDDGGSWGKKNSKGKDKKSNRRGSLSVDTQRGSGITAESNPWRRDTLSPNRSRWDSIQRDISFLSAEMHIPQETVASACHAAGGDIAQAVYALLEKLPPRKEDIILLDTECREAPQERQVLDILAESFPQVTRAVGRRLWRLIVMKEWGLGGEEPSWMGGMGGAFGEEGTGGWSVVKNGRRWSVWSDTGRGEGVVGGVVQRRHSHGHPSPRPAQQQKDEEGDNEKSISALFTIAAILQDSPRSPITASSAPASPPPPMPATFTSPRRQSLLMQQTIITVNGRDSLPLQSPFTPSHTHTLTTLTSSLNHALTTQSSLHRRASGRNNLSAAAAYYSQHVQALGQRLRGMEVERVLGTVIYTHEGAEVDLHGLRVKEGCEVAEEVVQSFFGGRERRGRVKIITGRGRHSKDGKGVLGPGVAKWLRREGWRMEVGEGWLEVVGRE